MTGPAVTVRDVTAGYGLLTRRDVLTGVSLDLPAGAATGLMGRNGAGKTTLIRLLLGVGDPRKGRVEIGDLDPAAYRERFGIGYLPERTVLPGGWILDDFLRYARYRSRASDSARVAADQARIVSTLELDSRRGEPLSTLSKGTARRAALAWALTGAPSLVILDEPASGLDPASRMGLRRVIVDCVARGATVLISSHEVDEMVRTCSHVRIVRNGDVSQAFTGDRLRTDLLESALADMAVPPPP